MNRLPRYLLIALLVVSNGGCVVSKMKQEDQLILKGRYAEVATYLEGQNIDSDPYQVWKLCSAYSRLKNYSKLLGCLDRLESFRGKGVEQFGMAIAPIDLIEQVGQYRAEAFLDLGNYAKAEEQAMIAYQRALIREGTYNPQAQKLLGSIAVRLEGQVIPSLSLLALAYALDGNRQKAEMYAKMLEKVKISDQPNNQYAKTLNDRQKFSALARTYMLLGDCKRSLSFVEQIPADPVVLKSAFWFESSDVDPLVQFKVPQQFAKSLCLYRTNQINDAKAGFDELLNYPKAQTFGSIYWMLLFERGRIGESEGKRKEAIEFFTRAIEVVEQQRSTINTEASKIGYVGDKQEVYHRLIAALMAEGQPAKAFEYVERSKARALVDLLASKQDFTAPQQVTVLIRDLQQIEEDSKMLGASSEESGRRSARGVQVKANIRAAAPELASLVIGTETGSSIVQSLLQPNETLLEYYYQGDDLYVFVVTHDRVQGAVLSGGGLTRDVEEFRKALNDPKSNQVTDLARKLYDRLIQPVAGQLTSPHLLLVGHGALHYLPFVALSDGKGYLLDRYSIRLLPSASVLQFLKERQTPKGESLLAFGNPDLGDKRYDLKFAEDEVQTISKIFPGTKILVRQEATKTAFKALGPDYAYLHLATHGKFDPDEPLRSGLLLANDALGEGFLSLGDLYSLRLNAVLVTLSACETGLGKVNNGDDVVGLTRGLLYAGSNSIVSSLWEVDDLATSLLMKEFYTNLKKDGKREALRKAQLATKAQYSHPYYWAAFQLTGLP